MGDLDQPSHPASREDAEARGGTEASVRVADVLLAFTKGQELGVSEIARELGLSKAVVHRVLQSLASRRLIQRTPDRRRYQLGVAAAALGATALRRIDLRTVALPVLRKLAQMTDETATVSALVGHHRVYLDQVLSQQPIRMQVQVGVAFPLYAGASSRAILAFSAPELQDEILAQAPLERLTPATLTDPDKIRESLREIRDRGFAVSIGERQPDAGSIAAPVWDAKPEVVGALSVCGPRSRFDHPAMDRFAALVREGAHEISRRLGHETTTPSQHGS